MLIKNIKNRISHLLKTDFVKNVAYLTGGTALSQIIILIAAPVLSRIYLPEDFGLLGVFTSTLSILVVISSLKYDIAIIATNNYRKSLILLLISSFSLLIITLICSVSIFLINDELLKKINLFELSNLIWLIPAGLIAAGSYQILTFFSIKNGFFKELAKTKFSKVLIQIFSQMGIGILFKWGGGLIVGDIIGRYGGILRLIYVNIWKRRLVSKENRLSLHEILQTMREFYKFPLITMPSAMIHTLLNILPVILITVFYGTEIGGHYNLGFRTISLPLALLGQSVAHVFLKKIADLKESDPMKLLKVFDKLVIRLSIISIIPFIILAIIAPELFKIIFGNNWEMAGHYVRILCISGFVQFVIGPVFNILNILNKQGLLFIADFIGFTLMCSIFITNAYFYQMSPQNVILFYSFSIVTTYLLLFLFSRNSIKQIIKL